MSLLKYVKQSVKMPYLYTDAYAAEWGNEYVTFNGRNKRIKHLKEGIAYRVCRKKQIVKNNEPTKYILGVRPIGSYGRLKWFSFHEFNLFARHNENYPDFKGVPYRIRNNFKISDYEKR